MEDVLRGWERLPIEEDRSYFRTLSEGWQGVVNIRTISEAEQMPRDMQGLVNGIYHYLGEGQAVIDIKTGTFDNGVSYLFSILKQPEQPAGMGYTFTTQIFEPDTIWEIQGWFAEVGTTGIRDSITYEHFQRLKQQGEIEADATWMLDPFDPENDGFARNFGELEDFDAAFPEHPLTAARHTLLDFFNKAAGFD